MQRKEYKLPNGKTAVFEYDVCGIGKITLECMDELMSMIADRPQEEWIPCSERLPKEGETVLVYMRLTGHKYEWEEQRTIEFGRISSDRYDAEGTGWEWLNESGTDYWEADWNDCIIAWMPLPKPYKGQEG